MEKRALIAGMFAAVLARWSSMALHKVMAAMDQVTSFICPSRRTLKAEMRTQEAITETNPTPRTAKILSLCFVDIWRGLRMKTGRIRTMRSTKRFCFAVFSF